MEYRYQYTQEATNLLASRIIEQIVQFEKGYSNTFVGMYSNVNYSNL